MLIKFKVGQVIEATWGSNDHLTYRAEIVARTAWTLTLVKLGRGGERGVPLRASIKRDAADFMGTSAHQIEVVRPMGVGPIAPYIRSAPIMPMKMSAHQEMAWLAQVAA